MSASPLDESVEMRPSTTAAEKKTLAAQEDLYSIMQACEVLENAYVNDATPAAEYASQCASLIGKFDEIVKALVAMGALQRGPMPSAVRAFLEEFGFPRGALPRADKRLLVERAPATVFHANTGGAANGGVNGVLIHEISSSLIAVVDTAKTMRAVDDLTPSVRYACDRLSRYTLAPPDWPAKKKMTEWLVRLGGMAASDELSEADCRQLQSDAEASYEAWGHVLRDSK